MEADELHELTAAYALDALSEDEERAYEEHLRRCPQCQEELRAFADTAAALAHGVNAPAPPPALRDRIVEQVRAERAIVVPLASRRPLYASIAVAAAAAAAAIGVGTWAAGLSSELEREREALEILAHPRAQSISLAGAEGRLVVTDGREAALVVSGLGAPPAGHTYEIWVIQDEQPVPAGLFAGGEDVQVVRLDEPVPPGATVAVTIERAGGVEAPTGEPLFRARA
ncbi:MAG TPA: anti-sigma factor [Gaiellaceae bacterium]|nr:anti-sigma factor [Gaiellaceae bacterium]